MYTDYHHRAISPPTNQESGTAVPAQHRSRNGSAHGRHPTRATEIPDASSGVPITSDEKEPTRSSTNTASSLTGSYREGNLVAAEGRVFTVPDSSSQGGALLPLELLPELISCPMFTPTTATSSASLPVTSQLPSLQSLSLPESHNLREFVHSGPHGGGGTPPSTEDSMPLSFMHDIRSADVAQEETSDEYEGNQQGAAQQAAVDSTKISPTHRQDEGFGNDTEDENSEGGIELDIEMDAVGNTHTLHRSSEPTNENGTPYTNNMSAHLQLPVGGESTGAILEADPSVVAMSEYDSDEDTFDLGLVYSQSISIHSNIDESSSIPRAIYLTHDRDNAFSLEENVTATPVEDEIMETMDTYIPIISTVPEMEMGSQDPLHGYQHPINSGWEGLHTAFAPHPPPQNNFEDDSSSLGDIVGGNIIFNSNDFDPPLTPQIENLNDSAFSALQAEDYAPMSLPLLFAHTANEANAADVASTDATYTVGFSDDDEDDEVQNNDVLFGNEMVTQEMEKYNSDFAGFCGYLWNRRFSPFVNQRSSTRTPHISAEARRVADWSKTRPEEITIDDVERRGWDMQGIQWEKLELSKKIARRWRQSRYLNYRNMADFTKEGSPPNKSNSKFYSFLRHNPQPCRLLHFQLRNVLTVVNRNDMYFSTGDQVIGYHPITRSIEHPLIDLSEDVLPQPIRISTLGGCGGRDAILIAGTFNGTYAMRCLNADISDDTITGTLTDHENGITNHIQLIQNRRSGLPAAVISSNDDHIRIMNVADPRRRLIEEHPFEWAVNCSATSPDSRLRVVVGDSKDVLIVDADRGRTEFVLTGHKDFGFAAAWSDDGYTIATGNQDQTVRIFDARNLGSPIKVFRMRMAGCRTLRFSPIGNGGKHVLAMAEPADLVHIVETANWDKAQTLTFWGEIGGLEFTPNAEELIIANCDKYVGGLMTFGRKDTSWYHGYELVP